MIVVSRQAFFEAKFRVLHYEKKWSGHNANGFWSSAVEWIENRKIDANYYYCPCTQNKLTFFLLEFHFFFALTCSVFFFFLNYIFGHFSFFFSFPLIQWRIWHWHFLWLQSNIKIVMRWKVNQNNRSVHMHFVGRRECIFEKINWSSGCWC